MSERLRRVREDLHYAPEDSSSDHSTSEIEPIRKNLKRKNQSKLKSDEEKNKTSEKWIKSKDISEEKKLENKEIMRKAFEPWVFRTYGDAAKTKTITVKKHERIQRALRGEEVQSAENSKFRFWVKSKGFFIGEETKNELFVPLNSKIEGEIVTYKRVALVEEFFDIIYTVHVETEAKNGKHAGQKRTYRAITEKYSFLPREAVTKFLLQCSECQKRGNCPPAKILKNTNDIADTTATQSPISSLLALSEQDELSSSGNNLEIISTNVTKEVIEVRKLENISKNYRDNKIITNGLKENEEDSEEAQRLQRLKAFNMFVRLFVDENLDRGVPISRQPKEKVQAIIDSCFRQFPELADKARNQIRTYLKSCRSTKKISQDEFDDWQALDFTPTILAQACENEAQNAKRMRMGLEPLAQPLTYGKEMIQTSEIRFSPPCSEPETPLDFTLKKDKNLIKERFCSALAAPESIRSLNQNFLTSMYHPNFFRASPTPFVKKIEATNNSLLNFSFFSKGIEMGPTDLSLKERGESYFKSLENSKSQMRELIRSYRESASFLLRSADELESLLIT